MYVDVDVCRICRCILHCISRTSIRCISEVQKEERNHEHLYELEKWLILLGKACIQHRTRHSARLRCTTRTGQNPLQSTVFLLLVKVSQIWSLRKFKIKFKKIQMIQKLYEYSYLHISQKKRLFNHC